MLTLIRPLGRSGRARLWECACDCGTVVSVANNNLSSGKTKSCGCIRSQAARNREASKPNRHKFITVWSYYRRNAVTRGLPWELSRDQFDSIITRPCEYCGDPPSVHQIKKRQNCDPRTVVNNGIDRINSLLGYTPDNCVPCCTKCNFGKSTMSQREFVDHAIKVARKNEVSIGNLRLG